MKILLTTLNSKYIHSNLALKYLYALCGDMGHNIELKEFTINNSDDYIYGELLRGNYDLICFSCYIWNIEKTLYLVENYKKACPASNVLLGGPEVTWRSVEIMKKYRSVDYILAGEGEESFPLFLKSIKNSGFTGDYDDINGLFFRKEDKIYANPKAEAVDFSKVPFPFNSLVGEMDKIMYYESSRGCPFSCSYCISAIERGVRARPVEIVKEELAYFIYKGVKQVKFVDRTFNYNNSRSLEILKYLIEADKGVTNFHFELCGDMISDNFLELVSHARPGLFQFEIGVQTTNEDTLEAINRKCDFHKLSSAVKRIIEMGNIHLHLDLIAGLPYEDYSSFAESFNKVYSLGPHMLQLGFLKLLPGTPIKDRATEYNYVYRSKAPYEVISNKFISAKELAKLKMVELVLDLYYNRGGFSNTLHYLACREGTNPFGFYEDFAYFYHLKGFQHRSQNKEDLYRILYYYGSNKYGFDEDVFNRIKSLIKEDMDGGLNSEAVRKFMKTGWELPI
jgi:radical SAM superfamily enzyme YgiQ (UPF0313 family)